MSGSSPDELPHELRAFIYSCIDGVEQVEILALLGRSGRPWNARGTAAELGLSDAQARHHLETLTARGLLQIAVARDVSYAYAPKTADLRGYADQLIDRYATSRSTVLRFISTNPHRLKRFSDAFKLRDPE
jgi:predicted ArsR family transcriptional regulator